MFILDINIWWETMNYTVKYKILGLGIIFAFISVNNLSASVMDQISESFLVKPQKLNKRKVQEDLVRSCAQLLKESSRFINDISILNECAGDCAANVLEGALAKEDKKRLDDLSSRMKNLSEHLRKERDYLKNEKKEIDELLKQKV